MPTVLVTGSNRGLGLEFVRQYAADGWQVIATCRRPEEADELNALTGGGAVSVERLDVADEGSIAALRAQVGSRPIDLLVNNAGVYGDRPAQVLGSLEAEEWLRVLRVDAIAPVLVAQALADNLIAAAQSGRPAVIATLTSKMGSIAENTSGGSYAYRSGKAALNAAMRSLAIDLAPRGVLSVLLHPGWVRTAMGGPNGLIDPPESIAGMRRVIAGLTPHTSGGFFDYSGKEVPW